jgi:uncharacterized protein (TIGR02001 family)
MRLHARARRSLTLERSRALLGAAACACLLPYSNAAAQWSGTATAVSDYRFRGISLSDDKPAAQLSVNYDDPAGWYGGLFGSTVQLFGESSVTGQAVVFGGLARELGGGVHWDLGGDYVLFSASRGYDYGEVYAGIATERANAHVHFSPDYFGLSRRSVYVEANATYPLDERVTLIGHVGVLVLSGTSNPAFPPSTRNPVDGRAGVVFDIAGFNVQIAWVGTNGSGYGYPVYGVERRNTAVVSVSRVF